MSWNRNAVSRVTFDNEKPEKLAVAPHVPGGVEVPQHLMAYRHPGRSRRGCWLRSLAFNHDHEIVTLQKYVGATRPFEHIPRALIGCDGAVEQLHCFCNDVRVVVCQGD